MADRKGPVVVLCAIDGSGNIKALEVDASDYLKVALASAGGSDLLTELALKLNTSDLNIEAVTKDLQVDVKASGLPTGAATSSAQATALTELQSKLETSDLNIEAVTKDLQVDVKTSGLPTGAATQTTLAALLTELNAKLETADLEIVSSIPSVGQHGWFDGAWRRQPMTVGISDVLLESVSGVGDGANPFNITTTAVPAGQLNVYTSIAVVTAGGAITEVALLLVRGGDVVDIAFHKPVADLTPYITTGMWVLKEDDYIRAGFRDLGVGDGAYLRVIGYVVDIDQ